MTGFLPLMQVDVFSGAFMAAMALLFLATLMMLYFVFRLLKRGVKMAFRMALVAAVLVITLAGAVSIWWFGTGAADRSRPAPTKKK